MQLLIICDVMKQTILDLLGGGLRQVKREANFENQIVLLNSCTLQMPDPKEIVMVSFCWKMNSITNKTKCSSLNDDVLKNYDRACILFGPLCVVYSWCGCKGQDHVIKTYNQSCCILSGPPCMVYS